MNDSWPLSRQQDGIFKALQGKQEQTSILYPVKLSFKIEGKKKETFSDEHAENNK